ncbi:hypothetical protein HY991_04575 [Candidatus Micrarchaeota archaeon]|nr:hypothetical protein [Candidatus Micrarchaeota archaeon]
MVIQKKVVELLSRLEEKYPASMDRISLMRVSKLNEKQYPQIETFAIEKEYARSESKNKGLKITAKGIDYLRENKKLEVQEKQNTRLYWATIIIAFATIVNVFVTYWNTNIFSESVSPKILMVGRYSCPQELPAETKLTLLNGGKMAGVVHYYLEGNNIEGMELTILGKQAYSEKILQSTSILPKEVSPYNADLIFYVRVRNISTDNASFTLGWDEGGFSCNYARVNNTFKLFPSSTSAENVAGNFPASVIAPAPSEGMGVSWILVLMIVVIVVAFYIVSTKIVDKKVA